MSNRDAFLTMLAQSEGTDQIGDNGYNVLVGGSLFESYADHPRQRVKLAGSGIVSTAAGRYQILEHIFDSYKDTLSLSDFSPASQDAIALQMIRERHALTDIDEGNIDDAIEKCSNIWASLPGNTYGQRENKITVLRQFFVNAGGSLNPQPESTDVIAV